MRRVVLALVTSLGLTVAGASAAGADINLTQTTQVTLSCNDGHSALLNVDATTLTSLSADVTSINSSGTALSCMLDTALIDPSGDRSTQFVQGDACDDNRWWTNLAVPIQA